ncbi:uncharacterized protein LOC103717747 [Phoenix dactylifera]|uniref:Uncharacterized protein LOC103717747 n=1 Tax=Phoenix dactylifera TaxID=42345 RepID=A0A8B7MW92_PHODC|nr:uncharacterized protein LOC103717747 [Phoenix dactylifera]
MRWLTAFGLLVFLAAAAAFSSPAAAVECNNVIYNKGASWSRNKEDGTHYDQARMNDTWRNEFLSRYHLAPSDDAAWMGLLPRRAGPAENQLHWAMVYRSMKRPGPARGWKGGGSFLKDMSLHDVRIDPDSVHGQAQKTNLEYLLLLDPDRLVWSFRKTAGLKTIGEPYGGWEKPESELRGHFVGHFVSATALMWASTHNETIRERMNKVVDALDECQKAIGTGYLSAFPTEEFDRYEAVVYVWAPYYTIHKIMTGLLDQYTLTGNTRAPLNMVIWMAKYFSNRVTNFIKKYTIARHWEAMNEETGGMNDVLYRLYSITSDEKHLVLAHLFGKPCFLGPLALQVDSLSGLHANTHIPILIGAQTRYEVTGDLLYRDIGTVFMDFVNSSHLYATGGTSYDEHWTDPTRLVGTLKMNTEESCTTYNMLKVSRNLFRWTKEMAYADYYERALTNGVLGIQRGREPGVMIYFLPLNPGGSKAISGQGGWGSKSDSFWCCYGTATESFSKLGDSIYFEEEGSIPKLYVIQFISSTLNWKSGGIKLQQRVEEVASGDQYLRVLYTISANQSVSKNFTLGIRIPIWTSSYGAKATLNGQNLKVPAPGSVLSITKKWSHEDRLTFQLPIDLRTEAIQDDRPEYESTKAILFGHYLLAGLSCGAWDLKNGSAKSLSDWILPVPAAYNSQLISFTQEIASRTMFLSNLNGSREDQERTLTMEESPKLGSNAAAQATFRLRYNNTKKYQFPSRKDLIGESIMLEPFDLPGRMVEHQGPNNGLIVAATSKTVTSNRDMSKFRVVAGLDGNSSTISLESESIPGCFVHNKIDQSAGECVRLLCRGKIESSDTAFQQAASFTPREGLTEYHPISFIAKGTERNFLLQPLMSLRDETYSVYFNIGV